MQSKITTLAVPTCDRPELLARCLRSYMQNAKTFGRHVQFVVADDSLDCVVRQKTREALQQLRQEFGFAILYAGLEEKRAYAEALVSDGKVPRDVVEFALFNPHGCRPTIGANRNAILLQTVSELFVSVDDDTICELRSPEGQEHKLKFSSAVSPPELSVFPDYSSLLRAGRLEEKDFFALHEQLLGRKIEDCMDDYEEAEVDIQNVSPSLAKKLLSGDGAIRISWTGILGDSGFTFPSYLLKLQGAARRALVSNPSHYEAICRSRQILRVTKSTAIGGDGGNFQSVAIGFDHRTLLPPFMPVGRGEDRMFGLIYLNTFANDFVGYLPWAILHDPQPVRQNHRDDIWKGACQIQFQNLFRSCIMDCPFPQDPKEGANGLIYLGEHLKEWGSLDQTEFENRVRPQIIKKNKKAIDMMEKSIQSHNGSPKYWALDCKTFLYNLRKAEAKPDYLVPADFQQNRTPEESRSLSQKLILNYGNLLIAWPRLMESAKHLSSLGVRLAKPL